MLQISSVVNITKFVLTLIHKFNFHV